MARTTLLSQHALFRNPHLQSLFFCFPMISFRTFVHPAFVFEPFVRPPAAVSIDSRCPSLKGFFGRFLSHPPPPPPPTSLRDRGPCRPEVFLTLILARSRKKLDASIMRSLSASSLPPGFSSIRFRFGFFPSLLKNVPCGHLSLVPKAEFFLLFSTFSRPKAMSFE